MTVIREWLEAMADDAMSRAGEYGDCGPLPLVAPPGVTGYGAQRVIEFWALLADGTRITTTRPLNPPVPSQIRRARS